MDLVVLVSPRSYHSSAALARGVAHAEEYLRYNAGNRRIVMAERMKVSRQRRENL